MTQEQIYAKDISREINGVIKASSRADLATERYIGNLMAKKPQIDKLYNQAIDLINRWIEQPKPTPPTPDGHIPPRPEPPRPIKKSVTKQKAMKVEFNKPYLEDRQDVEAYISALRTQLLDYINRNTNVLLQD